MRSEIEAKFIRPIPLGEEYQNRLNREFELIQKFKFAPIFLRVMDILALAPDIPHLIRGSAGSSLVCYLLGISDLDPIREKIPLARFMNDYRQDFPDIDLDFPYQLRDVLLQRIYDHWPNHVARISTKNHYRELGAIRKAIRQLGFRKFLPKNFKISDVLPGKEETIFKLAQEIMGSQSSIAKHCGGIVYFEEGIPKNLQIGPNQIALDKDEIENHNLIKIDLLCNRGFSQLWEINQTPLNQYPDNDPETAEIFQKGEVLGLTYGESPTFRRMCLAVQPKNVLEVAMCLAMIRPASASRGKKKEFMQKWQENRMQTEIVFEDDAILWIMQLINCSEDKADFYRRAFAKQKLDVIADFKAHLGLRKDLDNIIETLSQLKNYSFCKSHALSYARLIWALAFNKKRNPQKFWHSTLKHCSSMYRPWVHHYEALKSGLDLKEPQKRLFDHSITDEFNEKGYWTRAGFVDGTWAKKQQDIVHFCGLIAVSRNYINDEGVESCFVTLCFEKYGYLDIILPQNVPIDDFQFVQGSGKVTEEFGYKFMQVEEFELF